MDTTTLAIAVIAVIAGVAGYFTGVEHGNLLYYGLMAIGVASLGYLFIKNRTAASV